MGENKIMVQSGVIKLLTLFFSLAVAVGIFINPLTYGSGDILKIKMFSRRLNEIVNAMGFSVNITQEDMISIIMFLEYIIFGISLMITTKLLYKSLLKNIFSPLFIGLLLSVAMGYYGYKNKGIVSGIDSTVVMFCGLLIGILIYLFIEFISALGKPNKLGKKSKYKRGR